MNGDKVLSVIINKKNEEQTLRNYGDLAKEEEKVGKLGLGHQKQRDACTWVRNVTSWVCDHVQPRAASTLPRGFSHGTDHNSNLKTDGPKLIAHLWSGLPGREVCCEMVWGFEEGI